MFYISSTYIIKMICIFHVILCKEQLSIFATGLLVKDHVFFLNGGRNIVKNGQIALYYLSQ